MFFNMFMKLLEVVVWRIACIQTIVSSFLPIPLRPRGNLGSCLTALMVLMLVNTLKFNLGKIWMLILKGQVCPACS